MKSFSENNYSKPAPNDDSVEIELYEMWYFLQPKKTSLDLESLLAAPQNSLWIGNTTHETLKRLGKRLIQIKAETHLIESNNFPQRHRFARFRRKTCCVSRSIEMIDLTMFIYVAVHVNKSINVIIWLTPKNSEASLISTIK